MGTIKALCLSRVNVVCVSRVGCNGACVVFFIVVSGYVRVFEMCIPCVLSHETSFRLCTRLERRFYYGLHGVVSVFVSLMCIHIATLKTHSHRVCSINVYIECM